MQNKLPKVLIINGPNLNMLSIREPEIYGKTSYKDLVKKIKNRYKKKLNLTIYQSNSEAKLINLIQKKYDQYDLYLVNAGGLSHTSIALMDALKLISKPIYNIHLSDINSREGFRKT